MKNTNLIGIGFIFIILTSCVIGRKVQYDKLTANIECAGTNSVLITTLDHRKPIKKMEKLRFKVGYLRDIYGIPFGISTKSDQTLADDISSSISETLTKKGYKCSVLSVNPEESKDIAIEKLKKSNSEISILFLIDSWWTDTYFKTKLDYDISINIYNKSGEILASKKFTEAQKYLGGLFWSSNFEENIPKAFKEELEKIFNDPYIKKSFYSFQ